MKPRAIKKRLKAKYPGCYRRWKKPRKGYMERLHKCPICGGSVPQNKALSVDIVMIDDKHITITSGKNSEVKEIYEKNKETAYCRHDKI